MAGKPGGYSGGRDGPMGSHVDASDRGGAGGLHGDGSGGGFGGGRTASVVGNRFGAPSASAQAAAQARNAPRNGPLGGMNPQHYGGRRTANPTPSYDMSLHNMMELSKMVPGPGMGLRGLGGALGLGTGPNFTGSRGMVNGPGDYDGPNRFGTMDAMRPKMPGVMAPAAARAQAMAPSNQGAMPDWWRVPY